MKVFNVSKEFEKHDMPRFLAIVGQDKQGDISLRLVKGTDQTTLLFFKPDMAAKLGKELMALGAKGPKMAEAWKAKCADNKRKEDKRTMAFMQRLQKKALRRAKK